MGDGSFGLLMNCPLCHTPLTAARYSLPHFTQLLSLYIHCHSTPPFLSFSLLVLLFIFLSLLLLPASISTFSDSSFSLSSSSSLFSSHFFLLPSSPPSFFARIHSNSLPSLYFYQNSSGGSGSSVGNAAGHSKGR